MGGSQARVQLMDGHLAVDWPAQATCTELAASCRLRDGTVHRSSDWTVAPPKPGRFRTICGPLMIVLELEAGEGCVRLRVEASAETEADVVDVAVSSLPRLAGSPPDWVLYNGYQSWDPAGHLPAAGGRRESWWTVGLVDERGAGIAAAAAHARSCCTRFTLLDGIFSAVWCETEMLEPAPVLFRGSAGDRWRSEEVRLAADDDVRGRLSQLLATPARRSPESPVGWLSWYHFGPWIGREDVLANADVLALDEYRRLGYRVVQLDDGWQQTYGEWAPNTKFPGGLEALCQELRRRDQVPGLWVAPFLVSTAADLASEAPDEWFVMDPSTGERAVDSRHRVFGPLHVLNASVPAVRTYLRNLFAGFSAAGIRYFKIDFLYAGAYAGLGALRAGVEAIREGVGDAHVVASGTPLLPVVGLVEGCRVGPDTATPLIDFETGVSVPTILGDEVLAVGRNAAARSILHPWFRLDTDVALVGGNLTLEQGRQVVTIAALSGGPFFAADDLGNLPPERLALLTNPEVMALVGAAPAVPDWEPDVRDVPPIYWRRDDVLAVFNWSAAPVWFPVKAPGARGARDLWARHDLPDFRDGSVLAIPAHGVRLLRLA